MELQGTADALALKELELKRVQEQLVLSESLARKLTEQLQGTHETMITEKQGMSRQVNRLLEEKAAVEQDLILKREEAERVSAQKAALAEKHARKKEKLREAKSLLEEREQEGGQLKREVAETKAEL